MFLFRFFIFLFCFALLIISNVSCTLFSSSEEEVSMVGENEEEEFIDDDEEDVIEDDGEMVADEDSGYEEGDEPLPVVDDYSEDYSSTEGSDEYGPIAEDSQEAVDSVSSEAIERKWVPLLKIPQATWKHDGKWINSVYIARDGDNLEMISSKIYGSPNLADELKSVNPFLKRREPKVGDKIYYSSPKRPSDRNRFLNYYDDIGQKGSSHDIQAGENIRTVSKKLLGHQDSWKEIWATNFNVESKGVIDEPTTVIYWPSNSSIKIDNMAAQNIAEVEAPLDSELTKEEEELMKQPLEGDALDVAMDEDFPPLDEEDTKETALIEEGPLPPPPSVESPMPSDDGTAMSFLNLNNKTLRGLLIGAIALIIGVLLFRIFRKKRSKEFDFSKTNIEIDNIEE